MLTNHGWFWLLRYIPLVLDHNVGNRVSVRGVQASLFRVRSTFGACNAELCLRRKTNSGTVVQNVPRWTPPFPRYAKNGNISQVFTVEEWDVLDLELRKIEEYYIETIGTRESSAETIAVLGYEWWPQTTKYQVGDRWDKINGMHVLHFVWTTPWSAQCWTSLDGE